MNQDQRFIEQSGSKRFASFRFDVANQCLWRDDRQVTLTPKAYAVLHYLVDRAGRLVTHDELLQAMWPQTYVQPEVLKKYILEIRGVLRDRARDPQFIETLPRRGYRFIAPVEDEAATHRAESAVAIQRPLVGRESALAQLDRLLQAALGGERQLVFVSGEIGIGKTTLVDAFARRSRARTAHWFAESQCIQGYGPTEPYAPVIDALSELCRGPAGRSVVDALASHAPTWLVQFPALLAAPQRAALQCEILAATRERMLREICAALEAIAVEHSLVLVFEDMHWADPPTLDLISTLARRRGAARLMIVATYRPVDVVINQHPLKALKQDLRIRGLCSELPLEPLDEAAVADYLATVFPEGELPRGLAGVIHRHADGNPLFMVAAVAHMIDKGLIRRGSAGWRLTGSLETIDLGVPETLQQLVELQFDQLSPDEQRVVDAASIVGERFTAWAIARMLQIDGTEAEDHCERLARRQQFLRRSGTQALPDASVAAEYTFLHAIYREALYRRLGPARRAMLHGCLGQRLEDLYAARSADIAAELALHFEESFAWERAVRYLRLAAENAEARYAHREAAALLQHALELLDKLDAAKRADNELQILERLGVIYLALGEAMQAISSFAALAEHAAGLDRDDIQARALIYLAYPSSWISSPRCLEAVDRALELSARLADPLEQAQTRMTAHALRLWAGRWDARDAAACGAALAELGRLADRPLLAAHLADYSYVLWVSSEYREGRRIADESLPLLLATGRVVRYLNAQMFSAWHSICLGEWGEALRRLAVARDTAEGNGHHLRAHTLRLSGAWLHLLALDFAGVVEICAAALPFLEEHPIGAGLRLCHLFQGAAEVGLGRREAARAHLAQAQDLMDRQPINWDWYWRMPLALARTDLHLGDGELAAARQEAQRLCRLSAATAERTWQALAREASARVAMAEQDWSRARDDIAQSQAAMSGFECPLAAWPVHATARRLYERIDQPEMAEMHRWQRDVVVLRLAESLPSGAPLRQIFVGACCAR